MRTSKRLGFLCGVAGAALIWTAPGCSGRDHTEICVGPDCFKDGVGGNGSVLHGGTGGAAGEPGTAGAAGEAGTAGTAGTAGEAGAGGTAGQSGTGGAAGSPEEPTDGGVDAQPDGSDVIDPPDGGGGDPDATVTPPGDAGDGGAVSPVCTLAFTSPLSADAGDITFTGADDIDGEACGSEFTISVSLSSNAHSVTLFVNDNPLDPQDVINGVVHFDAVLGNRGVTLNQVRAQATMDDNSTCDVELPNSLEVDCPGPSCSIESPVANDDGYLNATQDDEGDSGLQTDIVVSTEVEHVGETVRLEIDGDLDAVDEETVADTGTTGSATFATVTLTEGLRTVRAECSDAFGVTTLSPPTVWNVDITPCTLSLTSVGGSDPITPADDEDPLTNGIQVFAAGEIAGSDCKTLHAGVCAGLPASLALDLPPGGGTFTDLLVTVSGVTGEVDICATVEDEAGNLGPEDQIQVNLRLESPVVSIVTPTAVSDTHYNVLSDGDTGSSTCEADVVVSCSDVGQNVQLLADGDVIATTTCTGSTTTFTQASIPSKNDGSATALTAQQTASGLPAGVSAAVSVHADCDAPTCSITSPSASPTVLNQLLDSDLAGGFQIDVTVASNGNSVGLEIESVAVSAPPVLASGVATFADVSLDQGTSAAQAQCVDAAGNTTSSSSVDFAVDSVPCGLTSLVFNDGVSPVIPPTLEVNVDGQATGGDCASVRVGVGLCGTLSGSFTDLMLPVQSFSDLGLTLPSVTGDHDVCVEVADIAGNIGQVLSVVAVRVDAPTVAITAPEDQDEFDTISTCNTSVVASCSDAGDPVQLSIDGVPTGTPENCTVDHDVTFAITLPSKNNGDPTEISVSHTADGLTSLPSTIDVISDCQGPDTAVAPPAFSNLVPHRENIVRLSYTTVTDTGGGALSAFHLKCSADDIVDELTWTNAVEITPITGGPSDEVLLDTATSKRFGGFRSGSTTYCAVRGEDAVGLLTPIGTSAAVTNDFTPTQFNSVPLPFNGSTTSLFSIAPVGDVNGDGNNDFIVGYAQRPAQVYFGGSTPDTTPDITITPTMAPTGRFGIVVAGLGDINDDDLPDFAIGAPFVTNTAQTNAGSVYVFFGRAAGNDWPLTTINVAAAGAACGADICFHGSVASAQVGTTVTSTDFNGDGELDIVIGAPGQTPAGRAYVVLGGSQLAGLGANATVSLSATPAPLLSGFSITPPTATAGQVFGATMAGVGVGSDIHGDLVIGAVGGGSVLGAAYFLAGQDYTGPTGLEALSPSAAFTTGTAGDYGFPIAAIGDFDGAYDPINTPLVHSDDVCVGGDFLSGGRCNVFLRQPGGFDANTGHVLAYTNDFTDNDWGRFAADGFHNAFGLIGDLDNDARAELALGSVFDAAPNPDRLGTVEIFYGALGVGARTRTKADAHFQSADQGQLGVNFVGDIDGDGFNDLVLFDTDAGTASRLTLLR